MRIVVGRARVVWVGWTVLVLVVVGCCCCWWWDVSVGFWVVLEALVGWLVWANIF
jgi:hypothetical protein